jgi:hypothetical protein
MTLKTHILLGLSALMMVASLPTMTSAASDKKDTPLVIYQGKLQNDSHKPVAGIYPLTFSLHTSFKSGRAVWSEAHFVVVDNGQYTIVLGRKYPMPLDVDFSNIYLSVSISEGGEIVREQLDPTSVMDDKIRPTVTSQPHEISVKEGGSSTVDYAETAGFAYEAGHAKSASMLGDVTAKQLIEEINASKSKTSIGSTKRYTASAGGSGGVQYELKCPSGYVVVGVRGGAALYMDSIQLICSPLE